MDPPGHVRSTLAARRTRFGANYVPSSGWFYSWLDYSADLVRRDFEDLAGLGLDHIRMFPIWPWIQPNRNHISREALAHVLDTIDAAAEFDLDVAVDLVQGHLSSFDFVPQWLLTQHAGSVFESRRARDGLAAYIAVLAGAVGERSNVFALTLGNEVDNLGHSNTSTFAASREWASELLEVAQAAAPHLLCLHSVCDDSWYIPTHPFSPADAVDLGDLTTVHSWVFNGVSAEDGPLGPATTSYADYLIELALATSLDPGRPVWLQEIGSPRPDIPETDAAEFVATSLHHVLWNPALWGVTWWCSHDVDRRLLDFPEREYDLGLFSCDHRRKPIADVIAEVIAGFTPPSPTPRPALVCEVDLRQEPLRRAEVAPGSAFHRDWVRLRSGGPVAIAVAQRSGDTEDQAARNISTLIVPDPRS